MFNKIQNYLLLRHPLLWNIKIVPMLAVTLLIHALFFITGFAKGAINFKQPGWEYNLDSNSPTIVSFSVLLSLIVLIIWLVYYFRNNAYKSFYPKNSASLYKEWLLIVVICILNCSYTATFMYAQDIKKTSYFDKQETRRRLDIISMASLFTDASTVEASVEPAYDTVTMETVSNNKIKRSLLNRSVYNFNRYSYYRYGKNRPVNRDSLNNARVKGWLKNNRKDSVLWLLTEFEKITKSHDLKGNITPQQWLNFVYTYPNFADYKEIASSSGRNEYNGYTYQTTATPQYYVPMKEMTYNYEKIHDAELKPFIKAETGLVYLCVAFGLSLSIFSFRVTSGRGWLIGLVSVGITAMITGLFSVAMQTGESYPIMWLLIILGILIYYLAILAAKTGKGLTDITLNALLWLLAWLLPIIISIILLNKERDYNYIQQPEDTFADWIEDNMVAIFYVNLVIIMVYMFFLSNSIKKWKGIAEA